MNTDLIANRFRRWWQRYHVNDDFGQTWAALAFQAGWSACEAEREQRVGAPVETTGYHEDSVLDPRD